MGRAAVGDQRIEGSVDCPDDATFTGAGDYEITVDVALPDWTPAADVVLASHWGDAGNRAWRLLLKTTGALSLEVTTDGTTVLTETSSVTTLSATAANGRKVVRALLDSATGNVDFSVGDSLATLAAYGVQQAGAGATAPFNSTASVVFGAADVRLYRGTLSVDGGATDVADIVAANVKQYEDSHTDAYGNLFVGAGHQIAFDRVYPSASVGVAAPVAGATAPVNPAPALPEMCTRINALSMVPVTGPVAPDPNA